MTATICSAGSSVPEMQTTVLPELDALPGRTELTGAFLQRDLQLAGEQRPELCAAASSVVDTFYKRIFASTRLQKATVVAKEFAPQEAARLTPSLLSQWFNVHNSSFVGGSVAMGAGAAVFGLAFLLPAGSALVSVAVAGVFVFLIGLIVAAMVGKDEAEGRQYAQAPSEDAVIAAAVTLENAEFVETQRRFQESVFAFERAFHSPAPPPPKAR